MHAPIKTDRTAHACTYQDYQGRSQAREHTTCPSRTPRPAAFSLSRPAAFSLSRPASRRPRRDAVSLLISSPVCGPVRGKACGKACGTACGTVCGKAWGKSEVEHSKAIFWLKRI